jgi:type IV pilus assembly protein PilM
MLPVTEMRTMLKYGSKNYLKEELNGHIFDCHPLPLRQAPAVDPDKKAKPGSIKQPVVVGGMPEQRLNDLVNAVKLAGLTLEAIVPGHIGPANAFEQADAETFRNEVVALVEVGFKNSCISILHNGDLVLNRVVGVGGDKLTNGLAETLSISYEEAEGIKIGMPTEVQSTLESLLMPLGRELRASADFFENQNEKPVTQILVSGGCACSEFLAQMLQNELMSPCKNWNPTGFLNNTLSPEQQEQFEPNVARLSVAIGAAATAF